MHSVVPSQGGTLILSESPPSYLAGMQNVEAGDNKLLDIIKAHQINWKQG
jgi:hypothetical protein